MVSTVDGVGQKLRAQMSGPGMLPSESHDLKACKKASNLRSISYEDLVLPRSFRDFESGLELGSRLGLQGPWVVHLALKVWTVSRQTEAPEPDT